MTSARSATKRIIRNLRLLQRLLGWGEFGLAGAPDFHLQVDHLQQFGARVENLVGLVGLWSIVLSHIHNVVDDADGNVASLLRRSPLHHLLIERLTPLPILLVAVVVIPGIDLLAISSFDLPACPLRFEVAYLFELVVDVVAGVLFFLSEPVYDVAAGLLFLASGVLVPASSAPRSSDQVSVVVVPG